MLAFCNHVILLAKLMWYIKPYAFVSLSVLDEATSQVSLDMECILYMRCRRLNITLLSVGHRSSLRQFHQQELRIENGGKWCVLPILESSVSGDMADTILDVRL